MMILRSKVIIIILGIVLGCLEVSSGKNHKLHPDPHNLFSPFTGLQCYSCKSNENEFCGEYEMYADHPEIDVRSVCELYPDLDDFPVVDLRCSYIVAKSEYQILNHPSLDYLNH